jgi:fatty-acyl-CoA synthase
MSLRTRLETRLLEARALARALPNLPATLPGVRSSGTQLLERNAERVADGPAILFEDERYTWAEFDGRANAYARFLAAHGVGPGDSVALLMDNRPEYLFTLMGLSKIRAVAACINTNLVGAPLAHAVSIVGPKLVVEGVEHAGAVTRAFGETGNRASIVTVSSASDPSRPGSADAEIASMSSAPLRIARAKNTEPAMYLYTSGTTGLPKAAVVTNQRFLLACFAFGKILLEATSDDVNYVCLPLYHGTAQWGGLGGSLATGATIALRRKFSASNFWSDAVRFGATRCLYVGELCRYLLQSPPGPHDRAHRVRIMTGNGLRPDVWTPFQERFGIPLIREFYGATEGNAPLFNVEGRPGMIGRLARGQSLVACDPNSGVPTRDRRGRCVEVTRPGETGLLVGRITFLRRFDGYVDGRATESKILRDVFRRGDAWFNTGDLVTLHDDDWLSFADRVGDTFRWKGENVSTGEVSLVLNRAPGVLESNVYGVAVPGADGRAGMACMRVSDSFDVDAFKAHVDKELPGYARPLFLRIEPVLRTTGTFKNQKAEYVSEGFDPSKVTEPLYALVEGRYVRIDGVLYERIKNAGI